MACRQARDWISALRGPANMTIAACAELVERGDPDRFRAAMASAPAARDVLFPLYAFNVEVARAPWVTKEAMIAEMRLQWWRDALEEIGSGKPHRKHEVVDPLAVILDAETAAHLDRLIAARRWDIYTDPFEDQDHFESYIAATNGALMQVAAQLLGPADPSVIADAAYASGVANLLRAVPELEERGRKPLLDGRPDAVQALAEDALSRLDRAAKNRRAISAKAAPAMMAAWAARPVLRQALRDPGKVITASLLPGAARLARVSLLGWWR